MRIRTFEKMRVIIYSSNVKGVLRAPASKSMTQRAIAASVMANGTSTIRSASLCEDVMAAVGIAGNLGAAVELQGNTFRITGNFSAKKPELNAEESGLCMRMFAPIAALLDVPVTITGKGTLLHRPLHMISEALSELGASCKSVNNNESLPIVVQGPIEGGNITIDGCETSQLLTGLLMALPLTTVNSDVVVNNLSSKAYIDMTVQLLRQFGVVVQKQSDEHYKIRGRQHYTAQDYTIEGDWSGAAFMLVAAALRGEIAMSNLYGNTKQPDSAIMKILTLVGAEVAVNVREITVRKPVAPLKPFNFDASENPDLVPPLVALASQCKGVSAIYGIDRLKHKESDRAVVLQEEFTRMGVKVELTDEMMKIYGGNPILGGSSVYSHNDHRIAMALSIAALCAENGTAIEGAECVRKSYPDFFTDLKRLKVGVKIEEESGEENIQHE